MINNPVVWFEIYVQDMPRARAFYEAVLLVKLEQMPAPTAAMTMEMWRFPSAEDAPEMQYGACGMLVKMEGVPAASGGTLVYFGSADCAQEAARVQANGGKVLQEKMAIGEHGYIVLALDTEGNRIGFHSM